MNTKPTASKRYPAIFSIFQAFSCGFMNIKVVSQIIKGFEKILLYCQTISERLFRKKTSVLPIILWRCFVFRKVLSV